MSQATLMQSLENFGSQEGSFWYFTNQSKFENSKNVCVADWARPGDIVAQVGFKPSTPACESNRSRGAIATPCPGRSGSTSVSCHWHAGPPSPLSLLHLFKGPAAKASISFLQLFLPPWGKPPLASRWLWPPLADSSCLDDPLNRAIVLPKESASSAAHHRCWASPHRASLHRPSVQIGSSSLPLALAVDGPRPWPLRPLRVILLLFAAEFLLGRAPLWEDPLPGQLE
jgi:hypothetical protein